MGGIVKGIGKGLGGVLKTVAPALGMIPGIGNLAGGALGGLGGLMSGGIKGLLSGGASGALGPMGMIGNIASAAGGGKPGGGAQTSGGGGGGGFLGTLGKIGGGIGKLLGIGGEGGGSALDAIMKLGGMGAGVASIASSAKDRKKQEAFTEGMMDRANQRDEFNAPLRESGRRLSLEGGQGLDEVDIFGSFLKNKEPRFTGDAGGQAAAGNRMADDIRGKLADTPMGGLGNLNLKPEGGKPVQRGGQAGRLAQTERARADQGLAPVGAKGEKGGKPSLAARLAKLQERNA